MPETTSRPALIYDYWLALYEGCWIFSQIAGDHRDETLLRKAHIKHLKIARNLNGVGRVISEMAEEDAEIRDSHVRFFVHLAAAFEDLVPAVEEGRIADLPHPNELTLKAQMLESDRRALAV